MYQFDPKAVHLAREFRAKPIGQHSAELERLLTLMRGGPMAGKYCLICVKPYELWVLARQSGERGVGPKVMSEHLFGSIEAGEWEVFKRRWRDLGGIALDETAL